jgi:hypothetical protein
MDGSPVDLIIIPIVVVLSLAGWIIPIYWADSHPRWRGDDLRKQADASAAAPSVPTIGHPAADPDRRAA